jgi:TusA-related sulfurtransferase
MHTKIDCSGLKCPLPIVKIAKTIKELNDNDSIEITATDPAFSSDVEAWCNKTGNTLTNIVVNNNVVTAVIKKGK